MYHIFSIAPTKLQCPLYKQAIWIRRKKAPMPHHDKVSNEVTSWGRIEPHGHLKCHQTLPTCSAQHILLYGDRCSINKWCRFIQCRDPCICAIPQQSAQNPTTTQITPLLVPSCKQMCQRVGAYAQSSRAVINHIWYIRVYASAVHKHRVL